MTGQHQDTPADAQISRLYREHATGEPPPAVDQHILAAARAALAPSAARGRRPPWWLRWRTPLTLAAMLVLTLSLSLLHQPPPVDAPTASSDRPERRSRETPTAAPTVGAAPASAEGRREEKRAQAVPKPSAAGARHGDRAADTDLVESAPWPSPAVPQDRPAAPSPAEESSRSTVLDAAPPGNDVASSAPSTANGATARKAEQSRDRTPPTVLRAAAEWLEEIRILRREGKIDQAERQLQEFRRAYPDYPLPDDFRP